MSEISTSDNKIRKFGGVRRAMAKILPICLFSFFISALILSVANDMYAFLKDDFEVSLQFVEPCSLEEFSKTLAQQKIVKNPTVFSLYVKSKHKTEVVEKFVGKLTLNANMSYREILATLS